MAPKSYFEVVSGFWVPGKVSAKRLDVAMRNALKVLQATKIRCRIVASNRCQLLYAAKVK
jgi:hypothetical protein